MSKQMELGIMKSVETAKLVYVNGPRSKVGRQIYNRNVSKMKIFFMIQKYYEEEQNTASHNRKNTNKSHLY